MINIRLNYNQDRSFNGYVANNDGYVMMTINTKSTLNLVQMINVVRSTYVENVMCQVTDYNGEVYPISMSASSDDIRNALFNVIREAEGVPV